MAALSACGIAGGGEGRPERTAAPVRQGPAADYPVVLGEPYSVDGTLYTPVDTLNYDEVGLAAQDVEGGEAVSAALRTLPLPSYVEVTSLETGRTILVRAERRGPMSGPHFVALSPGAMSQLGASEGTPVRVRRVNPPEQERAMLRRGEQAPERMNTPQSLISVLKRKLPVRTSMAAPVAVAPNTDAPAAVAPTPAVPKALAAVDLPASKVPAASQPAVPVTSPEPTNALAGPVAPARPGYVVQIGAYSKKENADRAATESGGVIDRLGQLYRVRTGPFAEREMAEASLAKLKDAGYSGARIYHTE